MQRDAPDTGATTIATPSLPPLDRQGFTLSVVGWYAVLATLIELMFSRGCEYIDPDYPFAARLLLRPMAGALLAQLMWPTWPLLRACVAAFWLGIFSLGGDVAFATMIYKLWIKLIGSPVPSWLLWCGGPLWVIQSCLAALVIRHHVRRLRRLPKG